MPYKAIPGVYRIAHSSGKNYVGSSGNIHDRWRRHRTSLIEGRHHSLLLQNAWRKHGPTTFAFEILEVCDGAERVIAEQRWIDELRAADRRFGYNRAPLAGTVATIKRSAETRERIAAVRRGTKASAATRAKQSALRKGKRRPEILGRKHTEAAKQKMSEAHRNRPPESAETTKRKSLAQKGRIISTEHRTKLSATLKGRPVGEKQRQHLAEQRGLRIERLRLAKLEREPELPLSQ